MKMKTFFSLLVAGAVSVGLVASPNVSAQSGSTLPNSAVPFNKEVPLSNKEVLPNNKEAQPGSKEVRRRKQLP